MIFIDDLGATGVVRNAIALATRLCAAGFVVEVAASCAQGALRGELDPRIRLTELLPSRWRTAPRPVRLARALLGLRRRLASEQPDLILSAGNHGHLLTRLAASAAPRARTIYRISNDLDHARPGRLGRLGKIARTLQFRLIAGHAACLALVSPHLLQHPLIAAAARRGKTRLIPNGVDLAMVAKRSEGPAPHPWLAESNHPTVLTVGRLAPQKNIETLLAALAEARRSRPLRLIVLGDGTDKTRLRLRGRAEALGIADAVAFVPAVPNPFPWMAHAAAFVLPSWWEGASNVLLEALACGRPIVASRTAGNAEEVLGSGRYGRLIDPADVHGLAKALLDQTGATPIRPGARATAFSRNRALDEFAVLAVGLSR
ncbi:glycosyltransferase [Sphingosinicella sp. BN140058]|uniref:glycosyltransferase n=1 Tax=Sphingosinicella sp. BN140058 TaxID=1892855 RepID=UPI0013EB3E21|nr:glycosyltransferase [Sphingosinicella sp. BN140058]